MLSLSRPLAVFDIEATGTFPARDRIVEIACLKIHPDGKSETFQRRINPTIPIPAEASAIHGITDQDVRDLPSFRAIAPDLAAFLSGCDLAGYNVDQYDIPLLEFEFARAGLGMDFSGVAVVDAKQIFFREEGRTLSDAVRFYTGEEIENAHQALADTQATARVLEGELRRYPHIPRTVREIARRYSVDRSGRVDPEGKIVVRNGSPFINFGKKYPGKSFDDIFAIEPSYFTWILNGDFSPPIKRFVRQYLDTKSRENPESRTPGDVSGDDPS